MLWLLGYTFEGNLFWPIVLAAIGFAVIWARTGTSAGGGTLPAWGARWHRSCPGGGRWRA